MDIRVLCLRSRQPRPAHPISPPPITGHMPCSPRERLGPRDQRAAPWTASLGPANRGWLPSSLAPSRLGQPRADQTGLASGRSCSVTRGFSGAGRVWECDRLDCSARAASIPRERGGTRHLWKATQRGSPLDLRGREGSFKTWPLSAPLAGCPEG